MATAGVSTIKSDKPKRSSQPSEQDRPRTKKSAAPLTVTRSELLVDGSDDEFRSLVHDSLAFSARLLSVRAGYGDIIGVTGPQYTILISIAHLSKKSGVSVRKVADHLHLSGSYVTNETNKLIATGFITKTKDLRDRRRVLLELTDLGWAKFGELARIQSRVNDVHFGHLSRQDFLTLRRIMADLVESTDQALSLLGHMATLRPKA
jgi:DNA-binding MarR family transcriptional regulator